MAISTLNPIQQLFHNLDTWRHLPAYQLERRADIFFSLYLPEVLHETFNLRRPPILIPEFPCHLGTVEKARVKGKNQSFKIDYLALGEKEDGKKVACFVELKTDNKSINEKQKQRMLAASMLPIKDLLKGISVINGASRAKAKYDSLHRLLKQTPDWEAFVHECIKPELVFVVPNLPQAPKSPLPGTAICFKTFAEHVMKNEDFVSSRFATSLLEWASQGAGTPRA